MKLKKLLLFTPLSLLLLTACNANEDVNFRENEYSFKNLTSEYDVKDTTITTYTEEETEVMYVNVKEYLKALDGFIDYDTYHFSKVPFKTQYSIYVKNQGYRFRLYVDYNKNTLSYNNMSVFSNTVSTSETDYGFAIEYDTKNTILTGGGEAKIELGKYFDTYYKNGNLYLPFNVMNTLFCSQNYYNVYFNGDMFYGTYLALDEKESDYNTIKESSLNNTTPTEKERLANYNHLLFVLNNFYGLKELYKVSDFENKISSDLKAKLLSTDKDVYNQGYKDLFNTLLDDPHTSLAANSFYHDKSTIDTKGENGPRVQNLLNTRTELRAQYQALGDVDSVRYSGDTAVIHFEDFKTGTEEEINSSTPWEYDSYYFMKHAMDEIDNHGGIKNVMLDLSLSPGGNMAAMARVFSFITNESYIFAEYFMLNDMIQAVPIKVDTNLDGNYDDDDSYSNYNWGILTSNFTYSAANELTGAIKNQNICKIYGEKSGGGMCAILPVVLDDGTTVYISGPMASVTLDENNNKTYLEYGIEVDKEFERSKFYNVDEIDLLFD